MELGRSARTMLMAAAPARREPRGLRPMPDRIRSTAMEAVSDASSDRPPAGTIMCTWGWCVIAEPQVCSTAVTPMRAPRCLGSAAIVIVVLAAALNRRS